MDRTTRKRGRPHKAVNEDETKSNQIGNKKTKIEKKAAPGEKSPVKNAAQLLNEIVPDASSLSVKLEFEETDSVGTSEDLLKSQQIDNVISEPNSPSRQSAANEDNKVYSGTPFMSRADMVLNMAPITEEEEEIYGVLYDYKLMDATNQYDICNDTGDCMYDFLWWPLPDPPKPYEKRFNKFGNVIYKNPPAEDVGPIKEFTAYEAFTEIWNEEVMKIIVTETNKKGKQNNDEWIDTTIDEMKKKNEAKTIRNSSQRVNRSSSTVVELVDIGDSDDDKNSGEENDDDFEEIPYTTREDMVLKMDNITKAEKEACYELFEQELVQAAEGYNFKMPHDDPECLFEFFFFPLPTPPIPPELKKRKFSEPVGPIKEFTAYEAFSAIWNKTVLEHIVNATNKNGKQFCKKSKWTDTTVDELYVYFAITLATSSISTENLQKYWNNSSAGAANFSQAITYKRFMILDEFLSFTDWNMDLYSQPQAKLFKIKPIVDHLNKSFCSLYRIGENIVVDEPAFMNKTSEGEYKLLKNKCKMQEIDVSDANNGYLWKLDILAQDSKVTRGIPPRLILKLLDELQNKGYTVWSNNVFNRLLLARVLKELGFNSVGTLRMKDIIPEVYAQPKLTELKVGEITGCTSGDLDFIAWRHKKLVSLVSSYHGKTTSVVDGKEMPTAFIEYKDNVAVLDRRDKILSDYDEGAKCKSWSRKMFRRLINISVYNSLILHKYNIEHSADSYKEFRLNLIRELVKRHREIHTVLPSIVKDENPVIRRVILPDSYWEHFPEEIGGVTGKTRQKMQKPCHLCQKKTYVRCPACDVALCLSTCHKVYHSVLSGIFE